MSPAFFDLTPDNLTNYVAEARAHKGLWVFHHIPKTAGSSLGGELAVHAAPYHNILPDYADHDTPFHVRLDTALSTLLTHAKTPGPDGPLRSASGHVLATHLRKISKEVPDTRFFTFLRNPLARIVSEYTYNKSPKHPPHMEFRRAYPTLTDFARDPAEHNKMAFFMFDTNRITLADALSEMGKRYDMIGLQERYPVSFLLLSSMIWGPALPKMRERVSEKSDMPELTDDVRRTIFASNTLDLEICTAVERVYNRIAPAVWANLRPEPA
ncbi:MAG: sulfotransferase family 2 domain-containing protein [Gemmobacter sp.]|nr:sulfotransferase family 2 domain-containing protein [Gemmobacter sp.]